MKHTVTGGAAAQRLGAVGLCLAIGTVSAPTEARSIIREAGNHPDYNIDLEFHFALGLQSPPVHGQRTGFGPGARLSVPLVHNGFISTINNNVAISTGVDWLYYGTFGVPEEGINDFIIPIVFQWNFWLSEEWSVFGEPGLAIELRTHGDTLVVPDFNAGARWLLTKNFSFLLRVGYPTASIGIGFLH